jgi:UDP-N-acetyl-D-mannosaminuronic acid transferase (WecB/TagA/CpsF family)
MEPRRMWKRYLLGNGVFLFRIIKERVAGGGKGELL